MLTEEEVRQAREKYGEGSFEVDMGAEAIQKLLAIVNLADESVQTPRRNCKRPAASRR